MYYTRQSSRGSFSSIFLLWSRTDLSTLHIALTVTDCPTHPQPRDAYATNFTNRSNSKLAAEVDLKVKQDQDRTCEYV
jgi:hypothetical protein